MTIAPTNAGSAEVTAIDTQARNALLLLVGSGLVWLVFSGVLALIASIQLHSPAFLANCEWLTFGRTQALRESAFIYGWAANAGLAVTLWILGRLGGYPLRGLNWCIAGTVFWNLGVTAGLIGIATGDMTSFPFLQLPRYVLPLLVFAYAAIALPGVLAWSGRRTEGMFAAQWYGVAALFLFPWLLTATQITLLWAPLRGAVQAINAGWYAQGVWTLWLAPLGLAAAYYIVPKVAGRVLPTYESAPLGFWTLVFVGGWTGGRHLIGGPVPAWISTMAVVACTLLIFHYVVIALNFRIALAKGSTAMKFLRFGLLAYLLSGVATTVTSFRGVAESTQFTFLSVAIQELGLYGAVSMMFFAGIYFMVPRITGNPWASAALAGGHRALVKIGVVGSIVTLAVAGLTQGTDLLDPKIALTDIFGRVRLSLLMNSIAQVVLIGANLLLLVNFCRTACVCRPATAPAQSPFRPTSTLEAHAS